MSHKNKKNQGGQRNFTVRVKTARGRKLSSTQWLRRQLNDPYVAEARRLGYRSRAAFKLSEIDDKYHLLKVGNTVIDLGAAPGGWTQVAVNRVRSIEGSGQVIAIDVEKMEAVAGAQMMCLDFMNIKQYESLHENLKDSGAHTVLSDMAAPSTGHSRTDHIRIMGLAEAAASFASKILLENGNFLCKVLQGGTEKVLLDTLKRDFSRVRHVKPKASRSDSSELYVLATGFKGSNY
ncbi:MAG: Ribosomal RNA large subunit methyltransferase E [Hyphomicrobiaceae bacterium hypho_1]